MEKKLPQLPELPDMPADPIFDNNVETEKPDWKPDWGRIKFAEWVYNKIYINDESVDPIMFAKMADKYCAWLEKESARKVLEILGYDLIPRAELPQYKQLIYPKVKLIHVRRSFRIVPVVKKE